MEANTETPTLTIEHGIPIPPKKIGPSVTCLLLEMKPGDSILIPKEKRGTWYATANYAKCKVLIRVVSKTEARVWKV